MIMLILGLLIFLGIHCVGFFPEWRQRRVNGMGLLPWKGLYSLIALAALVLCTSSLVLAMRYSRSREVGGPPPPRAARFSPFSPCSPSRATCSSRAPC